MDDLIEKVLGILPRKIIGGLVAMYILLVAAEKLQVTGYERMAVIICMTLIGGTSIVTHFILESKNPTNGNIINKPLAGRIG